MGIVRHVEPPVPPHIYVTPKPLAYGAGTLWLCDTCGTEWVRTRVISRELTIAGNRRAYWVVSKYPPGKERKIYWFNIAVAAVSVALLVGWIWFLTSL